MILSVDANVVLIGYTLLYVVLALSLFYAWKVTVRLPGTSHWAVGFAGLGTGRVFYAVYIVTQSVPFAAVGYIIEIIGIVFLVRG